MSVSPDAGKTLGMRPKLRHDVVFLDAPAGAYLRGPDTAFLIKGRTAFRWLTSLSPYLTGEHTLAQLTDTLEPAQRQTVVTLIQALIARGFAKDAGDRTELAEPLARRFAAQIEFVDHFADDPTGRFLRFHRARVALGGGGAALLAAATGLLRNGCLALDLYPDDGPERYAEALRPDLAELRADGLPAEVNVHSGPLTTAGADAVVYCTGPDGLARLAELARACHRDGPLLVPVVWDDDRAVVGPTVAAGQTPCWLCAQLRLTAAADPAASAEFWRQLALGAAAGEPGSLPEVTGRMLGNAAAFELFRVLTGALAPDTAAGVLLLDASTLESTRERVLPHPGCPVCRHVEVPGTEPSDGSDDGTYQRAEVLVAPNAGVFTRFVDDPLEQAPLKTARLRLPSRRGPREVSAFDVHTVMGARLAAYRVAVRDHAGRYADPSGAVTASAAELRDRGEHPVPWAQLDTAVGGPSGDPRRRWLPATVLGREEQVWVPAALALPSIGRGADDWVEPTVAGAAVAATIDGVIDQGLADALAYHALTSAIRGRSGRRVVSEEELVRDDDTAFVVKAAHRFGRRLSVLSLAGAEPAHAVLAVAELPGGGDRQWALAGGFDPVATRLAAALNAVGRVQVRHFEGIDADLGDPVLRDFDPATLTAGVTTTDAARADAPAGTDRAAVLAALAERSISALLVETTTRDVRASGAFRSGVVLLRHHGRTAD
ncbi:TOMM precursor leader peptide-binding protein [Micromonospora sp. NPDC051296]|uniref:TOMM precursor leader peptide-binding protein n=1 Tax=Micromonospora sp. NPDC051296 TaxID=3155046 RepID=UPI0034160127